MKTDYEAAWKQLEEAYVRSIRAEEFLLETLRIRAECGLLRGEWDCSLRVAV